MTILGVDQQVIRIWQRLPRPGIDWVGPQDDLGLVGWPTMLSDQVRVPGRVTEHRAAVGGVKERTFLRVDPRRTRIHEQHVRALDEWQALRIPPGGVATVGPIPEPGNRVAARR